MTIKRAIAIPDDSFFLFGPRGVGKSTTLKELKRFDMRIDLLKHDEFLNYLSNPSRLREVTGELNNNSWIWIDEVQKVPALLDEIHYLIEERKFRFALSGSSARKLKRQGANLLAGRAITRNMEPLSFCETAPAYNLADCLAWGTLPLVYNKPDLRKDILRTYVSTYIREEIQAEGHIRKIEPFVRFLEVAAIMNARQINGNNIAREARASRPSIDGYFSILVDTLIGHMLPAFQPRAKVREQDHPKFYWFDSGVARAAAGLLDETPAPEWLGLALETQVLHELRCRNHFSGQERKFYYYKIQAGHEIDFIIELRKGTITHKPKVIALEVKYSKKWDAKWEKEILAMRTSDKVDVENAYGIYTGSETLTKKHIKILPVEEFFTRLHRGDIF
jgi:uncharacterized protein